MMKKRVNMIVCIFRVNKIRLLNTGYWKPSSDDQAPYLQITFEETYLITSIAIKSSPESVLPQVSVEYFDEDGTLTKIEDSATTVSGKLYC